MSLQPATYEQALERTRRRQEVSRQRRDKLRAESPSEQKTPCATPLRRRQVLPSLTRSEQGAKRTAKPLKSRLDAGLIAWGRAVRKRDGNQCRWPGGCLTGDRRIDPHHIAKRSQRPDLKYDVNNGICLCRTHHDWTDLNHNEAVRLGLLSTESYELAKKNRRKP